MWRTTRGGMKELACKEVLCSIKLLASQSYIKGIDCWCINFMITWHQVKIDNQGTHTELTVTAVTQWSSLRSS
jgi:hypothetical protein